MHEAAGRDGHAVGGQDLLGGGLVERGTAGRERRFDELARLRERVADLWRHHGLLSSVLGKTVIA